MSNKQPDNILEVLEHLAWAVNGLQDPPQVMVLLGNEAYRRLLYAHHEAHQMTGGCPGTQAPFENIVLGGVVVVRPTVSYTHSVEAAVRPLHREEVYTELYFEMAAAQKETAKAEDLEALEAPTSPTVRT